MTKKDRLEALIAHYSEGKPTRFAKYIGVAPSTISTWLARDSFDYDLLFAKCEMLSPEWLLTGRGEMLKTVVDSSVVAYKASSVLPKSSKNPKGIPLIPLDAVAGFPATDSEGVYLEDCERYTIPEFEAKGANFLIRVSGDSMMPLYNSGDIIACRKIPNILFFQWGGVYVLDTSQGVLVKYVEEYEKDDECILCVSENRRFKPFPLPKSDIRSLSTIIGLVRLV
ncbi:S24 family peptidase [Alloprevotella tannerae]|uniref:LexA family transcriptional regulator n=1 Tax=Alloprevotella tannerae TaxID=76122 RepID=UPI0028EA7C67|nr:S24 family peptidase [Alloprevotella tannerae]